MRLAVTQWKRESRTAASAMRYRKEISAAVPDPDCTRTAETRISMMATIRTAHSHASDRRSDSGLFEGSSTEIRESAEPAALAGTSAQLKNG